MSSHTWTAGELKSNLVFRVGHCWRLVEAQHLKSTMKLVENVPEQDLLDRLLDDTKPLYPAACKDLHYLLFTPFRYRNPSGSRFRRPNQFDGVFYASKEVETAVSEISHLKLMVFQESPNTPVPVNGFEFRAFCVEYKSDRSLDLTEPPLNSDEKKWMNPRDYFMCQNLADEARKINVEIIESFSVRCPNKGKNISILHPSAFITKKPIQQRMQSWHIAIKQDVVIATKSFPGKVLSFKANELMK